MFRKLALTAVLPLVLLFSLPVPALADVVVMPTNIFFEEHQDECVSVERNYYANGESGCITLHETPEKESQTEIIANGTVIHISATIDYGENQWGLAKMSDNKGIFRKEIIGWTLMSQLSLVYDCQSFIDEHQREFLEYTGDYRELKSTDRIVLWAWPGSGIIRDASAYINYDILRMEYVYVDEQGSAWGFLGGASFLENTWVNLDDPSNDDLPAFNPAPKPELYPSIDVYSDTLLSNDPLLFSDERKIIPYNPVIECDEQVVQPDAPIVTLGLIVLVVVVTILLIRYMKARL